MATASSATARSTFTIDMSNTTPVEWSGGEMTRARWPKEFTGDLAGTSVVEVTLLRDDGGTAAYVGFERFDCTITDEDGLDRVGSFILVHHAISAGEDQTASWTIVDGSGTRDLEGISGTAQILPDHHFELEYSIGA